MDLFSRMVQKEETPEAPRRQALRKSPVDHWPLVILLERAAYLRKLAALGDGTARETLKEYPKHSTMLCFRSRKEGAGMTNTQLFFDLKQQINVIKSLGWVRYGN